MRIISLRKLVEDNDINIIEVEVGEGVKPVLFEVGSPDYREQELFFVKGDYFIGKGTRGENILRVAKLEKELNITIAPVEVQTEQNELSEEEKKLEEYINTPVTVVVFNRLTLASAGRETKRRDITAYAEAVVQSFREKFGEAELEDFAVIEIDFDNKAVALKSIALPVKGE